MMNYGLKAGVENGGVCCVGDEVEPWLECRVVVKGAVEIRLVGKGGIAKSTGLVIDGGVLVVGIESEGLVDVVG